MKPQDYINNLLNEADFSKIIKIRINFQKEYPKEFEEYLSNFASLNQKPWSPLCTSCINWKNNSCVKKIRPIPMPKTGDKQEYYCSSWNKRGI